MGKYSQVCWGWGYRVRFVGDGDIIVKFARDGVIESDLLVMGLRPGLLGIGYSVVSIVGLVYWKVQLGSYA